MSTRSQEELRANETSSHAGLQIEAAVTDENFWASQISCIFCHNYAEFYTTTLQIYNITFIDDVTK